MAEPTGVETPVEGEQEAYSAEEYPSEYTSESTASGEAAVRKPITDRQLVRHRPPQGGRRPRAHRAGHRQVDDQRSYA